MPMTCSEIIHQLGKFSQDGIDFLVFFQEGKTIKPCFVNAYGTLCAAPGCLVTKQLDLWELGKFLADIHCTVGDNKIFVSFMDKLKPVNNVELTEGCFRYIILS